MKRLRRSSSVMSRMLGSKTVIGIVDLLNDEPIGEGRDIQHVEESSFGGSDFVSRCKKLDLIQDFNGSLGNLGWDVKSLEERGLLRTHTSVLGSNHDGNGSNSTGLGRGSNLVVHNDLTDLSEISLGEHEANISTDVRKKLLKSWVVLQMSTDGFAHHGVFAHEHLSVTTKSDTDLLYLLGTDIVNSDHEASWVLVQQRNELCEVV